MSKLLPASLLLAIAALATTGCTQSQLESAVRATGAGLDAYYNPAPRVHLPTTGGAVNPPNAPFPLYPE